MLFARLHVLMLFARPVLNEERDHDRKGASEWIKYAEIMRVLVAYYCRTPGVYSDPTLLALEGLCA